jgi:hypothetical protein
MVGTNGNNIGTTNPNYPGALATVNVLPQAHTILCLSCHDTSFSGMGCATANGNTPCTSTISTGTAGTSWNGNPNGTLAGTNYAIGANGNLTQDHPVDVPYPTSDPTYWGIKVTAASVGTGYTVAFTDTTYGYGHPARLFSTDGVSAYIECGSCHNPHAQMNAVIPLYSGSSLGVPTSHFIRGQYRSTTEALAGTLPAGYTSTNYQTDNANFCMSCHSYPSGGFTGQVH